MAMRAPHQFRALTVNLVYRDKNPRGSDEKSVKRLDCIEKDNSIDIIATNFV